MRAIRAAVGARDGQLCCAFRIHEARLPLPYVLPHLFRLRRRGP